MVSFHFEEQLLQAAAIAAILSAIPLGTSMLVGLVVSIFQAATQIQEQTLSFVPKIAALAVVLFLTGPWCFSELVRYLHAVLKTVPAIGH